MLKTTISIVNAGGNEEHIIGQGFNVLCLANATTTFSIDSALAAAALVKINAESDLLTATAGDAADDGNTPDALSFIPYFEKGAAGGVATLDANGLLEEDVTHNYAGDGAPDADDDVGRWLLYPVNLVGYHYGPEGNLSVPGCNGGRGRMGQDDTGCGGPWNHGNAGCR